ncbi:MAG TPA: CPBP family intramembrane glutamic endopeptidase [Gaiellaceae bacterium]|nr:CPBP family intramembrane glutamic endopeptidase [Gaiellaceae bacterium]
MDQLDRTPTQSRGKLVAWLVFVGALTALSLGARLGDTNAPDDIAFRYSSSVAALLQYGLMLGVLLLIARGIPRRQAFALHRPESWPRALGLAGLALLTIYLTAYVYDRVLSLFGDWNPTEEQGLVPDKWDSSRAGAFVAFFFVVTFIGPAVEELAYRGLGVSLLMPYGSVVAVLVTGVLFGAVHGLVIVLLPLSVFGIVVGWLRVRTNSIYPPMLLHSTFNGTALIVSVTLLG